MNNNILGKCETEYHIRNNELNKSYFLDFYFPEKLIDLEIDGSQHNYREDQDRERDTFLMNKDIKVYRIKWKNINNEEGQMYIKDEIEKFLKFYNS